MIHRGDPSWLAAHKCSPQVQYHQHLQATNRSPSGSIDPIRQQHMDRNLHRQQHKRSSAATPIAAHCALRPSPIQPTRGEEDKRARAEATRSTGDGRASDKGSAGGFGFGRASTRSHGGAAKGRGEQSGGWPAGGGGGAGARLHRGRPPSADRRRPPSADRRRLGAEEEAAGTPGVEDGARSLRMTDGIFLLPPSWAH